MIEIKLVKHEDEIEQLVSLFGEAFGHEMSKEHWEWKYIKNPFAGAVPQVIVAADNGRIVGARPFFMTQLWIGSEKILAAEHCDTMVHPDYRKMGLFNSMGTFARDYLGANQVPVSFGFPGPMSRPGFLKQGYRKVAETEIRFRPVDVRGIISKRFSRSRSIRLIGSVLGGVLSPRTPSYKDKGLFQIEILDGYSAALDGLDGLRNPGVVELVRDERVLSWRFDRHPQHRYRYITAKRNNKLSGYAVISVQRQPNNLIYGMIIDYLVENGDTGCFRVLIEKAVSELARSACDVIVVWAFSDPPFNTELKKRFGFKSTSRYPFNRLIDHGYFDVLAIDGGLSSLDVYSKDSWRITYAFPDFT